MEKVDETKLRILKKLTTCWKLMRDTDRAILFGVCVSVYDLTRNELNDSAVHFLGVTRSSFMASPTENPLNLFHMTRLIMSFSLDQINLFDTFFTQLCPMSLYQESEVLLTTSSSQPIIVEDVRDSEEEKSRDSEGEKSGDSTKKKRSRLDVFTSTTTGNEAQDAVGDGNAKPIKTKKTITSTPGT